MDSDRLSFLQGDSAMAEAIRRHGWENTPLGGLEDWPDALKTTLALVLSSRFPQAIVWGPELITLYNDGFVPILGDKPPALGRGFDQIWSEAWEEIEPIARAAFEGQATYIENLPLMVERHGAPEQAYFTFCYSPIRDRQGRVVGMLDTVTETTAAVTAGQRLHFIDQLGRALADAADADTILATTTRMLAEHLKLSNCAYADMDPDEDGFTIRGDWAAPGSPSIVGRYSLAAFGVKAVEKLSAGEPLIIADNLRELAPHEAATFQKIGIASTICVPLIKDRRLTALMAIHDREPRNWSAYELALIGEVAERSWAHIQRVTSAVELRRSAAELAELNTTLERRVEEVVAERTRAEEALRHTQKLEAIGQLTGGVAHDFNNILTVIRSSADLLRREDLPEARRRRYVEAISETADRAAKLTSQLLAFSRRQALSPKVFDAAERVRVVSEMLRSVLGARIQLEVRSADCPCYVEADVGEFETALMNMAVNARDAMDGEGRLSIDIGEVEGLPRVRSHAAAPGAFVAVRVSDTGCGMAQDQLSRIFEPFFTTKEVGRGTGLGLSQVFGFAKQSGGEIDVVSSPGEGSTFTLYLPHAEPSERPSAEPQAPQQVKGKGRVLLVEDNVQVGEFASQLLQDLGYETELASHAPGALERLRSGKRFDILFSDVVMPGMSGLELGRRVREQWPHIHVLLTSGYSHVLAQDTRHGFELIRKPYSVAELSEALQRLTAEEPGA